MSTFNLEQAAAFLHMHPITLLRKAQGGIIPGAKLAKRWVFLQIDLEGYLRSQYIQQASQGDHDEVTICHSTKDKTLAIGGLKSRSQAVNRYNNLLALPTSKKPKNMKHG